MTATSLNGKIALITGGSSGIGKAITETLLQNKATVINADIADADGVHSNHYFFCQTNVDRVEEIQQLHEFLSQSLFVPDILICNAGIGIHEKLTEGDPAKWEKVIQTNVLGTLRVIRSIVPAMLSKASPHIVFMSSVSATNPYEYGGVYSASKAAINMIAATLRLELINKARVTVVAPGVTDTAFFNNMLSGNLTIDGIGFGALSAEEVADAVVYALTRPAGQSINEIVLRPGGQTF